MMGLWRRGGGLAVVAVAVILSIALFYILYQYDNKYTYPGAKAVHGVFVMEEDQAPLTYLTQGWEFYNDKLLAPADFLQEEEVVERGEIPTADEMMPIPTAYVLIGQYDNFSISQPGRSPYGSATYRLNIFTGTSEEKNYALELPEIFSAYTLWVGGKILAQNGNPDPQNYEPQISGRLVSFAATDRIEIVLAVTNYDHYYSGLVYPPAFGTYEAVSKARAVAVVISAARCFIPVAIGFFYFFLGLFSFGRKLNFSFGILCFLYAGSVSYALVHFISSKHFKLWYAIEDTCFYLFMTGLVYVFFLLYRVEDRRRTWFIALGSLISLMVVVSSLWTLDSQVLLTGLAVAVKLYKLVIVVTLGVLIASGLRQKMLGATIILISLCAFTISLAVDAVVPFYEPILLGWPTEIGGFVMIVMLGIIITMDQIATRREKVKLAEENLRMQESYELLMEKIGQTKKIDHDVRHHMRVLQDFAMAGNTEKIVAYTQSYVQDLKVQDDLHFSEVPTVDAILRYYHSRATAETIRTNFMVSVTKLFMDEKDLCVLLGNVLENALEACLRMTSDQRYIYLHLKGDAAGLTLVVDNSFDGILQKSENVLLSSKRSKEPGIGLSSAAAIARKYGGQINAAPDEENKVFQFSAVMYSTS